MTARDQNALTIYGSRFLRRDLEGCLEVLELRGYRISLTISGGFWRKRYHFEGDHFGILLLAKTLRQAGVEVEGLS